MTFVWATRGRHWGFRFLKDGGFPDPIPVYDSAFVGTEDEPSVFRRVDDVVALRFSDPLGRTDQAGRVIPHEFVVLAPLATTIESLDDGLREIWPLVADEFARIWDLPRFPESTDSTGSNG